MTRKRIMKGIKNRVCTPEQSIRLFELGVNEFSLLKWRRTDSSKDYEIISENQSTTEDWAAYDVAELGEMLSSYPYNGQSFKNDSGSWGHTYRNVNGEPRMLKETFLTEAETRAALLIYYLETGMVTDEQCNNALDKFLKLV